MDALYVAGKTCGDFNIAKITTTLNTNVIAAIYITISCLILSLIYFFCRPRNTNVAEMIFDNSRKDFKTATTYWLSPRALPAYSFQDLKHGADLNPKLIRSGKFADTLLLRQKWEDPLKLSAGELSQFRFRQWWRRGRVLFFCALVGTMVSVVLCLVLINNYVAYFMLPTAASGGFDYCTNVTNRLTSNNAFFALFCCAIGFCLYLLV